MNQLTTSPTLIILNGGRSSRMNHNAKDLLEKGGQTFLEAIIQNGKMFFENIIVVGFDRNLSDVHSIKDEFANKGPVGGIYSGLKASKSVQNVIVACDMPFLDKEFFNNILKLGKENVDKNVIPTLGNNLLPLSALYLKKNLTFFNKSLEEDQLKLMNVVDQMNNYIIQANQLSDNKNTFANINTLDDYLRLEKLLNG